MNELARQIVDEAAGEALPADPDEGKDPAAVALSRKGGLKGVSDHVWTLSGLIGLPEEAERTSITRGRYAKTRARDSD